MKTSEILYNRSAILLSLLTTYQGREIELLHDFAEVFNELMDFSNDVVYGCTCGSPDCLNKAKRDFARILQREVEGLMRSPIREADRATFSAARAKRVAAFEGNSNYHSLPELVVKYSELLNIYAAELEKGLYT